VCSEPEKLNTHASIEPSSPNRMKLNTLLAESFASIHE